MEVVERSNDQDSQEDDDDDDGICLADFSPCLDVTDQNEGELTERLYGAMHHAFDALDQHYPAAFLEPNPLFQMMPPNTTARRQSEALSSDLQWAVKVSMDTVYPENFSIPQIENLPDGLRNETHQEPPTPPPSDRNNSDADAPIQIPTATQATKATEEEEDDVPFDENETTVRKPPATGETNDATPQKQNLGGSSDHEPERSALPAIIIHGGEAETLEPNSPLRPITIHRDKQPVSANKTPSGSISASTTKGEEQAVKSEHDLPGGGENPQEQPLKVPESQHQPPLQPAPQESQKQTLLKRVSQSRSTNKKDSNQYGMQDVEAQQETTALQYTHSSQKPLELAEQTLSTNWLDREREKEIAKFESIKSTIRVVLLTLLIVLPFGIGAYLTLEKEKDDD